jgi:PAS domain S-box-containing protein
MLHHEHDHTLVVLSVFIAIFASYTALDLANSVTVARGRIRLVWLTGGSLAMGVGIWSMHFIAMLAFRLPGIPIAYDVPLLVLSVLVAIVASAITLYTVSRPRVRLPAYIAGSLFMGAAIAGMHYIGIASMRFAAHIHWDWRWVILSILIAVSASFAALWLAARFRNDLSARGFWRRGAAGVVMGFAISGMHYAAMAAVHFAPAPSVRLQEEHVLATSGLAVAVIGTTLIILGIAIIGSVVDRALSRRAAMTEQVTQILESITDAFFSVDRSWRFTYVNKVAHSVISQISGKGDDLRGLSLWEAIPGLIGTRFEREYRHAMGSGRPAHFEEFYEPMNIWFDIRAYPSRDGLSVYFRDVTERKRAEQELERAVRARDEFLSIASHELRTPLTSLKLQTQMTKRSLEKEGPAALGPERIQKLVSNFDRQIDRITRLVEDMLDISRISTGKLTIAREQVNLCDLLRDLVERHAPLFEEKQVQVSLQCEGLIIGHWDQFRIEQVVSNLLTNAARYGESRPVEITAAREGEFAVLRVVDHGRGIAAENQERIFGRFERAVASDDISGLGLGLYIVRSIVEMHGGSIVVASELGHGAIFTVRLPLKGGL